MFALKEKSKRKKEDRTCVHSDLIEDLDFKGRILAAIVFETFRFIFLHLLAMKDNGIHKADLDLVISLGCDINRWKIQITWKPTGTSFNQKSLLITSKVRSSASVTVSVASSLLELWCLKMNLTISQLT